MEKGRLTAVYDCNALLQGLASPEGPAGRCVEAALKGEVVLYFSAYVIAEVRDVASRPRVMAKLHLEAGRVDRYCQAVQLSGVEVKDVPGVFSYPRDPDDAHYVELAMAAGASYIVTWDRDLLDLMDTARAEGRDFMMYFGGVKIVTPVAFADVIREKAKEGRAGA